MSNNISDGSTEEETATTISSPRRRRLFQTNIVRDLTLVSLVFMIISVYRSHKSLHQQFIQLTSSITTSDQLPLLFLPPNTKNNYTNDDSAVTINNNVTTIAYAISLTSCGGRSASLDGAAVLRHSIRRFDNERYNSHFVAFIHPNATACVDDLRDIGYETLVRPTPVNNTSIRGNLRKYVEGASCCGSAEFLKLYTYQLTDYPIAVHLDMDVAILKPLYDLYDAMLDGPFSPSYSRLPIMWNRHNVSTLPTDIQAFFTRDYNMLSYAGYRKPHETAMQGGFLVVKPNATVFDEMVEIILEGKYEAGYGWGGPQLKFGGTYGSAQIQGLVAYYYGHVHPHSAVELNRCIVNTMVDKPFDQKNGTCLAPLENGTCEDCRKTSVDDVVSTHFTVCQKPWWCPSHNDEKNPGDKLCFDLHKRWFQLRWELEMERARRDSRYNISFVTPRKGNEERGPWVVKGNQSFCGRDGYIPMNMPSGGTK